MTMPDELQSVLKQTGGIVTTAQANEVGVSNEGLSLLAHSGDLERVTTGIYVLPDELTGNRMLRPLRWLALMRAPQWIWMLRSRADSI